MGVNSCERGRIKDSERGHRLRRFTGGSAPATRERQGRRRPDSALGAPAACAGAEPPQQAEGEQASVVSISPPRCEGIVAHGLETGEALVMQIEVACHRCMSLTPSTGAPASQIVERVGGLMPVFPDDHQAPGATLVSNLRRSGRDLQGHSDRPAISMFVMRHAPSSLRSRNSAGSDEPSTDFSSPETDARSFSTARPETEKSWLARKPGCCATSWAKASGEV